MSKHINLYNKLPMKHIFILLFAFICLFAACSQKRTEPAKTTNKASADTDIIKKIDELRAEVAAREQAASARMDALESNVGYMAGVVLQIMQTKTNAQSGGTPDSIGLPSADIEELLSQREREHQAAQPQHSPQPLVPNYSRPQSSGFGGLKSQFGNNDASQSNTCHLCGGSGTSWTCNVCTGRGRDWNGNRCIECLGRGKNLCAGCNGTGRRSF